MIEQAFVRIDDGYGRGVVVPRCVRRAVLPSKIVDEIQELILPCPISIGSGFVPQDQLPVRFAVDRCREDSADQKASPDEQPIEGYHDCCTEE
jgi:hypothetical protein